MNATRKRFLLDGINFGWADSHVTRSTDSIFESADANSVALLSDLVVRGYEVGVNCLITGTDDYLRACIEIRPMCVDNRLRIVRNDRR